MLKRFGAMSRKTLLMLSAAALCALGIGTALAIAGENDTDDTLNVAIGTKIVAKSTNATFTAGSISIVCESEGGYVTSSTAVPNEGTLNSPAESFTKCNNGATVTVNGSPKIKLDSADVNPEKTGEDPSPEDKDTATMILPSGSSIVIKVLTCTITVAGLQEFLGTAGEEPATLTFSNVTVNFTTSGFGCPASPGKFSATYNVTPSTLDDLS